MNGYVLFKNGKVKKLSKNKKYKKSKVYSYLIEYKSKFFGTIYKSISPTAYRKIKNIGKCSIQYFFIDGYLYDDDAYDVLEVKNKYKYDNGFDILKKLDEIAVTECVLNDLFWVHNSYYAYLFTDFKIKVRSKNGNKIELSPSRFYNKIKMNFALDNVIQISENRYELINKNKIRANKDSEYFTYLNSGLYIKTSHKFINNIKNIDMNIKLFEDLEYEESKYLCEKFSVHYKNITDTFKLFKSYLSNKVVKKLEEHDSSVNYKTKCSIYKINCDKNKISIKKFFKKYFYISGGNEE